MRAPASSRYCANPLFSLSVPRTPVRSSPKKITFSKSFHFATLKRLVVVVEPMLLSPKRDPELTDPNEKELAENPVPERLENAF